MNQIINLYSSYINDFNTIERFANFHQLDVEDANLIIEMGRKYNDRMSEQKKSITNFTNKYYRWK